MIPRHKFEGCAGGCVGAGVEVAVGLGVAVRIAVGDGFEQAARVRMTSSIVASSAFVTGWDLR